MMKIAKHLQALGSAINAKRNGGTAKDNYGNDWSEYNAKHLADIKQALLAGRLYLGVDSVSRSGMSRIISIRYIKGGKLRNVCDWVYTELAGCDKNRRIHGCGMDMLFEAQYRMWRKLLPKTPYQKMPRYNQI